MWIIKVNYLAEEPRHYVNAVSTSFVAQDHSILVKTLAALDNAELPDEKGSGGGLNEGSTLVDENGTDKIDFGAFRDVVGFGVF